MCAFASTLFVHATFLFLKNRSTQIKFFAATGKKDHKIKQNILQSVICTHTINSVMSWCLIWWFGIWSKKKQACEFSGMTCQNVCCATSPLSANYTQFLTTVCSKWMWFVCIYLPLTAESAEHNEKLMFLYITVLYKVRWDVSEGMIEGFIL